MHTPLLTTLLLLLPVSQAATPSSFAVTMAETLMQRNPGTPQDRLARWSYWKGYTLMGFEMLWRATADPRYLDFIKR
ncbi:MAG TPA: hypothetical protein VML19_25015, partial [Verrucomicrobiae bacterium]|nr:hypothetical protein [Verrucomicrobiae bacterium]